MKKAISMAKLIELASIGTPSAGSQYTDLGVGVGNRVKVPIGVGSQTVFIEAKIFAIDCTDEVRDHYVPVMLTIPKETKVTCVNVMDLRMQLENNFPIVRFEEDGSITLGIGDLRFIDYPGYVCEGVVKSGESIPLPLLLTALRDGKTLRLIYQDSIDTQNTSTMIDVDDGKFAAKVNIETIPDSNEKIVTFTNEFGLHNIVELDSYKFKADDKITIDLSLNNYISGNLIILEAVVYVDKSQKVKKKFTLNFTGMNIDMTNMATVNSPCKLYILKEQEA